MIEVKAPADHDQYKNPKIFLAGSIEMGKAEPWRHKIATALATSEVILLNPRRDDWDNTWVQSIKHAKFKEQVVWEMNGIDEAALVIIYFDPETLAPITLLELGHCLEKRNVIVCCPEGFYRKGNVEITCDRYGIDMYDTFEEFVEAIVAWAHV